ncbi:MAG: enoyl-CoA hydratase/isomerase family protein [Verrucomicrobia bacterium]|nr:enoyl-CoA hydratase/isomerase family protein [Verrucomicrobiota bacterium]
MNPPAASSILVAADGPVTTVTLNRPDKRNALNVALLAELCAAVAAAEAAPAPRLLVLRGAGPVFCSGLDLAEAAQPDFADRSAELVGRALGALAASRLITIAAVHGAAIAGGAGLMSACDFAIATRDAKFGYPEVRRGLVPALIMTFLRRQLRERDARELLLLGKPFSAEHALAIGLVNRVVADEAALAAEVQSLVNSLLQGAPEVLAGTKRALNELWPSPLQADLERARACHGSARNSAEAREGIAAFNEKRPPNWAPR